MSINFFIEISYSLCKYFLHMVDKREGLRHSCYCKRNV